MSALRIASSQPSHGRPLPKPTQVLTSSALTSRPRVNFSAIRSARPTLSMTSRHYGTAFTRRLQQEDRLAVPLGHGGEGCVDLLRLRARACTSAFRVGAFWPLRLGVNLAVPAAVINGPTTKNPEAVGRLT
jgi:hypothetical protein